MQTRTTRRYHLSGWLKLTTQEATGVGEDVEKGEPSCTVGGNAKSCRHSGKGSRILKNLKAEIPGSLGGAAVWRLPLAQGMIL